MIEEKIILELDKKIVLKIISNFLYKNNYKSNYEDIEIVGRDDVFLKALVIKIIENKEVI